MGQLGGGPCYNLRMNLDEWLTFYRDTGYTIRIEADGTNFAWMVYDDKEELIDWWWLYEADQLREPDDMPRRKPGE